MLGACVEVSKVSAAAAGDEDFTAWLGRVVDDEDAEAALGEEAGAEEACGAGAEDGGVVGH